MMLSLLVTLILFVLNTRVRSCSA